MEVVNAYLDHSSGTAYESLTDSSYGASDLYEPAVKYNQSRAKMASEVYDHAFKYNQPRSESESLQHTISQDSDMIGHETTVEIIDVKEAVALTIVTPSLGIQSDNFLVPNSSEGSNSEETPLLQQQQQLPKPPSRGNSPTASQHSFGDDVGHDVCETFLITRLTLSFLRYLWSGLRLIAQVLALGLYATFLMPGFVQVGYQYFFSKHVHRSIAYGDRPRNRLDLYLPVDKSAPKPVMIFVTGGAWIIGYKAWGALLGLQLLERDIIVFSIDYRNYPQAVVSDMVDDVSTAIGFVVNNVVQYGGDPNRIYLAGQSAGAHLSVCALIDQARVEVGQKEGTLNWKTSQLKGFLGLSGGYNLPKLMDYFDHRGLSRNLFLSVMEGEASLPIFSPELVVQTDAFADLVCLVPPMYLFHGTGDYSIPCDASETFGDALAAAGVNVVTRFYPNKTHTDVFIQDPMRGGYDQLFQDFLDVLHEDDEAARADDARAPPRRQLVPDFLLRLASWICPF